MQGTIKGVKVYDKNIGFCLVEDENTWYSGFKNQFSETPERGMTVEFDFKQKGQWNNITSLTIVGTSDVEKAANKPSEPVRSEAISELTTSESILFQCGLKAFGPVLAAKMHIEPDTYKDSSAGDLVQELYQASKSLYHTIKNWQ